MGQFPILSATVPQCIRRVNWKQGEDVSFLAAVSHEGARKKYPEGWKAPKAYLRIVRQPK